ncbi:MAG: hypothetical protein NVS3B16_25630 [Vulcanimicrobiaceae bacterium]
MTPGATIGPFAIDGGVAVGAAVGCAVGTAVGVAVGTVVGCAVGAGVAVALIARNAKYLWPARKRYGAVVVAGNVNFEFATAPLTDHTSCGDPLTVVSPTKRKTSKFASEIDGGRVSVTFSVFVNAGDVCAGTSCETVNGTYGGIGVAPAPVAKVWRGAVSGVSTSSGAVVKVVTVIDPEAGVSVGISIVPE